MTKLVLFFTLLGAARSVQAADACDRECLRGFLTQYLDGLVAHDASKLAVAPNVKFTEDTVVSRLGDTKLWKNASKVTGFRQDYIDVRQGVAAVHAKLEESGMPVLFTLRIKVADRKLTEVETMIARNREEGMIFNVNAMQNPSKPMNVTPSAAERNTREELMKIATGYPAGLKVGSFVKADTQFAADTYRFENGQLMAGPGCTFMAGCEDIKSQRLPTLAGITNKVVVVDEEQGLVVLYMDFGAGSVMGAAGAMNTLHTFEAFKVYGGKIHAVEAVMKMMPTGTARGWD